MDMMDGSRWLGMAMVDDVRGYGWLRGLGIPLSLLSAFTLSLLPHLTLPPPIQILSRPFQRIVPFM